MLTHIRTVLALTLLITALLVAIQWWNKPDNARLEKASPSADLVPSAETSATRMTAPQPLSSFQKRIASTSLDGTQPPGRFNVDADGRLIIDSATRAIMDYFMSLAGEIPDADIRSFLIQWAMQDHDENVGQQCAALFDRYREWLHRFASGEFSAADTEGLREKLLARRQARDQILGAHWSEALYADDDAYDRFSLARMDILQSTLSPAEREVALTQLEATLPENIAADYQQQRAVQSLTQTEAQLRTDGVDDAKLYQYRQRRNDFPLWMLNVLNGINVTNSTGHSEKPYLTPAWPLRTRMRPSTNYSNPYSTELKYRALKPLTALATRSDVNRLFRSQGYRDKLPG